MQAAALAVARALEEGRVHGRVARSLSWLWERASSSRVVRPLTRPTGVRLITVGGPTLGGSGKTPLALAIAREAAAVGARVAFVGHGYRARPGRARIVAPTDPLEQVGDEALLAARELTRENIPVVVARSRADAVTHASGLADLLVVDGVVQARPRASLAILAVDAGQPWGRSGAVPPCGDLRAPVTALVGATDRVVPVGEASPEARTVSRGVWLDGEIVAWHALLNVRVGLLLALAHPERVAATLAANGVAPAAIVRGPDHRRIDVGSLRRAPRVDLWIASAKCWPHASSAVRRVWPGRTVGVIDHGVVLGDRLVELVRQVAAP